MHGDLGCWNDKIGALWLKTISAAALPRILELQHMFRVYHIKLLDKGNRLHLCVYVSDVFLPLARMGIHGVVVLSQPRGISNDCQRS
jgi:hypothetical protein